MRHRIKLSLLVCALLLNGCGTLEKLLPKHSDNRIEQVRLVASDDVNQTTAVAVDVVYLFDEVLVAQLKGYSARKWFTEKSQFQLQYPSSLATFSYELVPLAQQRLVPKEVKASFPKAHQKAMKVMVFANYLLDKPIFSADITSFKKPLVTLQSNKISVMETRK